MKEAEERVISCVSSMVVAPKLVKCMTNGAAAKGLKFMKVFDPEQNGAMHGTAGIPLSSLRVVRRLPVTICRRCGDREKMGKR